MNWFRRDDAGKFFWPGFGQNMRVLNWIVERVHGQAKGAVEGPFGFIWPRLEQRPDLGRPSAYEQAKYSSG